MANKKRLFKDKPKGDSYGQYTFLENNFFDNYESSDSVPIVWDKFLDRDLYTTSEDNIVNLNIINSMIEAGGTSNNYLRYNQDTFMRFDEIILMRRPNIQYGIKHMLYLQMEFMMIESLEVLIYLMKMVMKLLNEKLGISIGLIYGGQQEMLMLGLKIQTTIEILVK